ncbi:MAG: DUF1521 domain-containing protein, partial [Phycisphaerales bacterium]
TPWPFPFPMPELSFQPTGLRGCQGKADASRSGLSTNGNNTIDTGRYLITVKEDHVRIHDRETNTWVDAYGDSHLQTSEGDRGQFRKTIMIDLPDGTKTTIKTMGKDAHGVSFVDVVAVIKGDEAVVLQGIHKGKPGVRLGGVLNNADAVGAVWEDGSVLRAGRRVDDLTFAGNGRDIVGRDPKASGGIDSAGGIGATDGAFSIGSGGSNWDRLWAIISDLEKQLSDKITEAEGINENDSGAMKKVFAEIERIQNAITQITTAMTNLQKADHDSKMAIVRNLA